MDKDIILKKPEHVSIDYDLNNKLEKFINDRKKQDELLIDQYTAKKDELDNKLQKYIEIRKKQDDKMKKEENIKINNKFNEYIMNRKKQDEKFKEIIDEQIKNIKSLDDYIADCKKKGLI